MDNGLIFPYPHWTVRAESVMLSASSLFLFREGRGRRADRSGSRQADGGTQEGSSTGRWLSRGKDVGRRAGKSACHEPEV
jgi:hypothetical protein